MSTTTNSVNTTEAAGPWQAVELHGRGATSVCDLPAPHPDAPTVLLLHGLGATGSLNWGPYLELLNEHYRVVVLDHRGHGRGAAVEGAFTLEDCADDAVALADTLGLEQVILVGYSMGGPIALLAWRRHPGRVQGLVLCATAGDFRGSSTERLLHLALEEVDRAARLVPRPLRVRAARSLVHGLAADATFKADLLDALHHHDEAAVREASRAVRRFSASWLDEVSVPAAVVVTERDHLVPPSRQRDLARRIPGAQVVAVEANHMAFCGQPNVLAPALVEACRIVAGQLDPERAPGRSRLVRRWSRWRHRRRAHQVPRAVGHAWRGHSPAEAEVMAG